jgi:hypothetical protein
MHFLPEPFIEANLPYLTLLVGVIACLLLYLGMGHQLQRLRYALVLQRQRVEKLELRLSLTTGGGEREEASAPDATRQKVLQLHGLGRSNDEIAQQAGLREAEVDFLLRVNQHLENPGAALALRKIS